jgi:tetratricopeptide (TPR) repeat protein
MSETPQQILERACAALESGDAARAWQQMAPLEARIASDADAAAAWLDLLRFQPARPTLIAEVKAILGAFGEDAALVTRACDALIRAAELTPPDEPQPKDGPAELAAAAAERCLDALDRHPAQRALRGYLLAGRGNALRLTRAYDAAQAALEAALAEQPERGAWWFNLGLLHKARHDFPAALAANQRAHALLGDERPLLWNLAICAIALGDGALAVQTLRKLGHDAQLGERGMPRVEGLPPVQVRAATLGSGLGSASSIEDRAVSLELLSVTPLSPLHGVVSSASYRDASIDYGDVVLWEPMPIGFGEHAGKPVPRFPLLSVLRKGDERRFRFVALQQAPEQVAALAEDLPDGALMFVHREAIEMLCPRCASGEHMRKHRHEAAEEHRLVYGKIVLPGGVDPTAFRAAFDARLRAHPGVQIVMPGLLEAIGDTAAAGKAHQMWRGLERTDQKRAH